MLAQFRELAPSSLIVLEPTNNTPVLHSGIGELGTFLVGVVQIPGTTQTGITQGAR